MSDPKTQQGESEYIAFMDECGDHSLTKVDPNFPIFLLSLVLVKRKDYKNLVLPAINDLKLTFWDHEGINLHSHDIRKRKGPFKILKHPPLRKQFLTELSKLIETFPFELFITSIDKQKLKIKYLDPANPYELAFTFIMEKLIGCMEQRGQKKLPINAESRGSNEDNELKAAFYDLLSKGSGYIQPSQFKKCEFPLLFHNKLKNVIGIQLADLCAHPIARHILKPSQENRAFEIIKQKHSKGLGQPADGNNFHKKENGQFRFQNHPPTEMSRSINIVAH